MSPVEGLVTLDIPARGEYVVLCRLALTGLLRDGGYSEDAVADLKLAVTEACTNSIRHAYESKSGDVPKVHVSYDVQADRVVLVVQDEGTGFNEAECEQPAPMEDGSILPSEGGMGMSIIRAVVDEFGLERPAEGGTRLTLTKFRDA